MGPTELFGDGGNGILFIGDKGKMMASTYAANARLLPTRRTERAGTVPVLPRVPGQADGHYGPWVGACLTGYSKKEVNSPFVLAGPLTEALLVANLAIRGYDVQRPKATSPGLDYPARNLELRWEPKQLKINNLDEINRFVKRDYRAGWQLG